MHVDLSVCIFQKVPRSLGVSTQLTYLDATQRTQDTERLQQPEHDGDDDDAIENRFYFSVHWQIRIDKPEEDADDDESDDDLDEIHLRSFFRENCIIVCSL